MLTKLYALLVFLGLAILSPAFSQIHDSIDPTAAPGSCDPEEERPYSLDDITLMIQNLNFSQRMSDQLGDIAFGARMANGEVCIKCLTAPEIEDICGPGVQGACRPQLPGDPSIVFLSHQMCRSIGINPNDVDPNNPQCTRLVPAGDLDDLINSWRNTTGPGQFINCYQRIRGICIAAEELQHAKDSEEVPPPSYCQLEINGDEISEACFQHFFDLFCDKPNPDLPQDQCDRLQEDLYRQKLQLSVNRCTCAQQAAGNPVDCDECEAQCVATCQALPDINPAACEGACRSTTNGYCRRAFEPTPVEPISGPGGIHITDPGHAYFQQAIYHYTYEEFVQAGFYYILSLYPYHN